MFKLVTKILDPLEVQLFGDENQYVLNVTMFGHHSLLTIYDLCVKVVNAAYKRDTVKETQEAFCDHFLHGMEDDWDRPFKWLSNEAISTIIRDGGSTIVTDMSKDTFSGKLADLNQILQASKGTMVAIYAQEMGDWVEIWNRIDVANTLKDL